MVNWNLTLIIGWLIIGTVSFFVSVFTWIVFGRICWLQMRIWMLAKRGYHLVEHIGLNKVRTYYYLKPNDNKFDFKTGFYLHQPDSITKTDDVLQKTPKEFGSFRKFDKIDDSKEYAKLEEKVKKWNYALDAVTLKWGIPIITYVGTDANPVNFTEKDKKYSAQVIRDIYIRLLATQQFGFLKKVIMIGTIALCVIALVLLGFYFIYKGQVSNMGSCIQAWNATQSQLVSCVNQTSLIAGQNSTVIL